MNLQIALLHHPVTALGPGTRFGIWFQGCSIGCPGCMSRHTWDPSAGREIEVDEIVSRVAACLPLDGVTISGGEPFEQPQGLTELLEALHALRAERDTPFDLLCFSGLSWRRLRAEHGPVLSLLDAIVPEPYLASVGRGAQVAGSANQPLITLSALGQRAHSEHSERVPLQLIEDGERVALIGTPFPGDLDLLQKRLADVGIELATASWLA